jgi:S-methylmethionine-dependent homocysteine/selenocysteine methylase
MTITLTDGGIETRIIYEFKHAIGDFESFELLEDESGRNILGQIYQSYADVAVRYALPIQLLAATDYQTWARDEIACAREFDLTMLGGCCGTDQRYIEALAKEAQVSL